MKLVISEKIAEKYADLRIGIFVGKELSISERDEGLEKLKITAERRLRNSGYTYANLSDHPYISAWRDIYRSFGVKPKKHNPTAEALVRRVLKGEPLPRINTLVDSYLLVETEHFLPIGGYDAELVNGNIFLRYSEGNEEFHPLGSEHIEYTNSGEVVYSDNMNILTRRWNFRDSDYTKITTESKNVILLIEAASEAIKTEDLEKSLTRLDEVVFTFCGGRSETRILYLKEETEISLY